MSIPRNHHYVSQVLIKKFLTVNKYYSYYSKLEKKVLTKRLERKDFAEKDLNSITDDKNEIDHKTIEDNLNSNFERDFNKYYHSLFKSIETNNLVLFEQSIKYLIRLGIIGDMRTREHQLETQNAILGGLSDMYDLFSDELKQEFSNIIDTQKPVKNKLPIDFNKLTDEILYNMGEINYYVFKAHKNHFFFLPDNTSIINRSKSYEDIKTDDGLTLTSPAAHITMVIYPINSKTIIATMSQKINNQYKSGTFNLSEEMTESYNYSFINNSRDKVICENEKYLNMFINKYRTKL
ncbi:DUF4238 domain-containing protein [Kordia sp.]|uniref:DUF4238 domain-containing protein n=1 Tax=Kordia sp. TaxID=1965332 RepID=UPI003D2E693C